MRVASLLAWRSLSDRPWRSALLLLGYGIGVGVMIALLSVGEALLLQARDRDLAAGGDLVLLPEGVDPAVLKVNAVTGMFLTIPQAGFIVRELLGGPRFGGEIAASSPQVQNRVVYVRVGSAVLPATASAGIPSLDRAARAAQAVPGARDSAADRAWLAPPAATLFDRLDRFHVPGPGQRAGWAEWDYFNFVDPATGAYGYLTLLVGGEGRGAVLLRLRRPGHPVDDVALPATIRPGDLSTSSAAQRVGPARVWIRTGGYRVTIDDPRVHADLRVVPDAGFYLPPGETAEEAVVSGYVVPVVRGWMSGEVRTARTSLRLRRAPAYHDHNWGTWRGVTWEWGEAAADGGAILYGALHADGRADQGGTGRAPAIFAWAPTGEGRGGFLGVFPVKVIAYSGWHPGPEVAGRRVPSPDAVTISAAAGRDRLSVRIRVRDALGSRLALPGQRAGPPRRVFLQLRGRAQVRGTVDGRAIAWTGPAAAETFVTVP